MSNIPKLNDLTHTPTRVGVAPCAPPPMIWTFLRGGFFARPQGSWELGYEIPTPGWSVERQKRCARLIERLRINGELP